MGLDLFNNFMSWHLHFKFPKLRSEFPLGIPLTCFLALCRWPLFSPQGHICLLIHIRVQPRSAFSLGPVFNTQTWGPEVLPAGADSSIALWLKKAQDHWDVVTYTSITRWPPQSWTRYLPKGNKNTFLAINFLSKFVAALYNGLKLEETSLLVNS